MADNLLKKIFGSKKATPSTQDSLKNMDQSVDRLNKIIEMRENKIGVYSSNAQKFLRKGEREKALAELKKKKQVENSVIALQRQVFTAEQIKLKIEEVEISKETFSAMKGAKTTLANIMQDFKVEDVEDLMSDINENIKDADDISDAMSTPFDTNVVIDDDLLEEELQSLEAKMTEEEIPSVYEEPTRKASERNSRDVAPDQERRLNARPAGFSRNRHVAALEDELF